MNDEDDFEPDADDDAPDEDLPQFDAGDPAAVKKRERKQAIIDRERTRFWEYVFSLEVGRREMFRLLRESHAFEDRFACGPNGFPQSEATWFQWGEAAWGKRLAHTWMVTYPEQFGQMLKENDPRFQKGSK